MLPRIAAYVDIVPEYENEPGLMGINAIHPALAGGQCSQTRLSGFSDEQIALFGKCYKSLTK